MNLSCVLAIFSRLKSREKGLGIVSSEAKIGLGKAQAKLLQQTTLIKLAVRFLPSHSITVGFRGVSASQLRKILSNQRGDVSAAFS